MKRSSAYFVAFVAAILLASPGMAKEEIGSTAGTPFLQGLAKSLAADGPASTVMDINNFSLWVRKDGYFPYSIAPNGCALNYPIGTANIIYGEGMLWGAKVSDGGATRVRVNGSTYAVGLNAGKVLFDADGNVVGSEDPGTRHTWRVRRDYKTADLTVDASHYFQELITAIIEDSVQVVYDQYDYDWNNWPAVEGAPFEDVDEDGVYDPAVDIPGWPGATQTIWLVSNDLSSYWDADENLVPDPTAVGAPAVTDTTDVSTTSYGAPPIGVEMQLTLWAYDFSPTHPLGNIMFKRARMIYTGLPGGPSDAVMDTCYFTQWSDPDLGTYTDDYVGCDTSLSLGYVYNGNAVDGTFMGDYGLPVPAGGYDFLQGPIVGGDTLGMTSFTYFGAGSAISDPTLGSYEGTNQFFNLMEGFLPRPGYPAQQDWNNPLTGEATKFTLSGDPVSGIGWIDGIQLPPGDRRLVMTTGPFVMALGDTQDVVLATIGGMGQDNISSVTVLKYHDTFAQYAYDNDFNLPSPPPAPVVEVTGLDGEILLDWSKDWVAIAATEETEKMGFVFEGYNVYQLPTATSAMSDAVKVATYDVINLVQAIFDPGVDPASGFILEQLQQSGTNSGIQRYFSTTEDAIRVQPISNGIPYYFAVTAYSYLADFEGSPFKTLESSPNVLAVIADVPSPGDDIPEDVGNLIDVTHTGSAGGSVTVKVVSPTELTGDDYEVYFDQQHYYMDVDGVWKTTNYADSVGKALGKVMDVSGSTISAIAYTSPTTGTRDLKFILDLVSPDYNYAEGIKLTFPPGIVINSASSEDGIASIIDDVENTVLFGSEVKTAADLTGGGVFAGGEMIEVSVETPTLPLDVDYIIYDDGWATLFCADPANAQDCIDYDIVDAVVVNAEGVCTISEEAYAFKTEKHWNLRNVTTSDTLMEDQTNINGVDLYTGEIYGDNATDIMDGIQLSVNVGYAAPWDFVKYDVTFADATTSTFSMARAHYWSNQDDFTHPYVITSYGDAGWAASGRASDPGAWGAGSSDVGQLQSDYELRFTGEYDDPVTVGDLVLHPIKEGTGSIATFVGARGYDKADHPMGDDVSTDRSAEGNFLIRIPFEVWNVEADPEEQLNFIIYDRLQADPADGGDYYAFPNSRMYCYVLHTPYAPTAIADVGEDGAPSGADADFLTWNLVFWQTEWETGDVLAFNYDNPIQLGTDVWSFSTTAPTLDNTTLAEDAVELINVFPNPYYGFHPLETSRMAKWVKFNHLPQVADIRIFNLGGTMVRVIHKDDATQYAQWNLQNQSGYPVASGIYIIYIDLPDLGKHKILKLAIIQEEQILTRY